MPQAGVYRIRNTENGKVYVGSTCHIDKRWKAHVRLLDAGMHHCRYLQHAWNSYGQGSFEFEIIESAEGRSLIMLEQIHLDLARAGLGVYNMNPKAVNSLGMKRSLETKKRISAFTKANPPPRSFKPGHKQAPEAIAKMAASLRGRKLNDETLARRKIAQRLRVYSLETRAKCSAAANKRWAQRKPVWTTPSWSCIQAC